MTERLHWEIQQQGDVLHVQLQGSIDEDADFAALLGELEKSQKLRMDLSQIHRINSCGVREWVNFIRNFPENIQIELEQCSPVVVSQINMISNFLGSAHVLSVQAPFVCDACGQEQNVLLTMEPGKRPTLNQIACSACGGEMQFDDIEDSYFAFLG